MTLAPERKARKLGLFLKLADSPRKEKKKKRKKIKELLPHFDCVTCRTRKGLLPLSDCAIKKAILYKSESNFNAANLVKKYQVYKDYPFLSGSLL